jgi:hypothetical protein
MGSPISDDEGSDRPDQRWEKKKPDRVCDPEDVRISERVGQFLLQT